MLILRRRAGESFLIGEGVKVTVIATKDKEVQLAIDAPKEVAVLRAELANAMRENREAADEKSMPQELIAAFSRRKRIKSAELSLRVLRYHLFFAARRVSPPGAARPGAAVRRFRQSAWGLPTPSGRRR